MIKITIKKITVFILSVVVIASCTTDPEPSLYDDGYTGKPAPVINEVIPAPSVGALAGVTEVTIKGTGFSAKAEENFVTFGGNTAEILSATTTEIKVKAPNVVKDSVELKVAVQGALKFSNSILYKLLPAVSEFYGFQDFELPYAITTDKDGSVYVSLVSSNAGQGIKKITPDGELSDWAPKGGETFYNSIKMGANNTIYGVRTVRAVFQVTEGNSPKTYAVLPNGVNLVDLDIDKNQNIWTAGNNDAIYRINTDKQYKAFPFAANVKSIRIFDDYVYTAAIVDSNYAIYRFQIINDDSLGEKELYFDFPDDLETTEFKIGAITFTASGDLFIGTNLTEPVMQVHSDKSYEYFYPGLMSPSVYSFAWTTGNILYYTKEIAAVGDKQTIIKVDTERQGAPYYGRD